MLTLGKRRIFLVEEFMSEKHTKINYEFLDSAKNFMYEARETGKTHSSYQYESMLFYSIRNGDIDGV